MTSCASSAQLSILHLIHNKLIDPSPDRRLADSLFFAAAPIPSLCQLLIHLLVAGNHNLPHWNIDEHPSSVHQDIRYIISTTTRQCLKEPQILQNE